MNSRLEILRRALKNIKDEDIEVFLHYNPDVAVQIVNDLLEEPSIQSKPGPGSEQHLHHQFWSHDRNLGGHGASGTDPSKKPSSHIGNVIDKETRSLALRIKKCPHYKSYKEYSLKMLGGGRTMANGSGF